MQRTIKKIDAIYCDIDGNNLKDLCFMQTTISNSISENKASGFFNSVKNNWIDSYDNVFDNKKKFQKYTKKQKKKGIGKVRMTR